MNGLRRLWLRLDHLAYLCVHGHAVPPVEPVAVWLHGLRSSVLVDRRTGTVHAPKGRQR